MTSDTTASTEQETTPTDEQKHAQPLSLGRRIFGQRLLIGLPALGAALALSQAETAQAGGSGDNWKMEGNGNVDDNDFIGATNNKPVIFKSNNSEVMRITTNGRLGVGEGSPQAKLHVKTNSTVALRAETTSGGANPIAIRGSTASPTGIGVQGSASAGGPGQTYGVFGSANNASGFGVYGINVGGVGVYGSSASNHGVRGQTASDDPGDAGVYGGGINGVIGDGGLVGVYAKGGSYGVSAEGTYQAVAGAVKFNSQFSSAIYGTNQGFPNAFAGSFNGKVEVVGQLSKSSGSFKIDHPLDPENKYLYHSFVESPDMLNIYNGVVTLDSTGAATVELPNYFEALNIDYRYQLTPMGGAMPDLHVAQEISGGRFSIAGGKPGLKVSWLVTGVRNDPFAQQNRIQVEVAKDAEERGSYLHPEEHGQSEEKSLRARQAQALKRS